MGRKKKVAAPPSIKLEELEPRILFSGGIESVLAGDAMVDAIHQNIDDDAALVDLSLQEATASDNQDLVQSRELVFVDTQVEDYQSLLDDILEQADEDRQIEIVVLDSQRNGIQQITETLTQYDQLSAIHLISHGSEGSLQVGSSDIDQFTLEANANAISSWQSALTAEADILLYGCDLAGDETGENFVNTLAELTGADVAASDDLTGSEAQGGDWDLEYKVGEIESELAISEQAQAEWENVLAAPVADATSTGTSTGGSISISHTVSGSNRLMLVGVSINETSSESVSSITYNGESLTFVGSSETGDARVEIWQLVAPDLGTYDVDIVFSGSTDGNTAGVMTFTGVDQSDPLSTFASGNGSSESSGLVKISSATDELVYGVIAIDDATDYDVSVGAGQTEDWDLHNSDVNGGGSTEAGAATVGMTWSWSGSDDWAAGGVSIKAAGTETTFAIDATTSISEELTETATFTVTLGGVAVTGGDTASVDISASGSAVSGTDYDNFISAISTAADATTGVSFDGVDTLTFDSTFNGGTGEGDFTFTVDAIDDQAVEGSETIVATLSNASVTTGTVEISNTVSDSFTEASDTAITSHTPSNGQQWTEVYDNSSAGTDATINASTDAIHGGSSENSVGQAYAAGPSPTSVDQTISFTVSTIETDSGTKPIGLFGRWVDSDNFYYLQILPNSNGQDSIQLSKMEDGVRTVLASVDATIADGDTFMLEITDATKKIFHNGSEVLSDTDNALTAAGEWGMYFGDVNGSAGGGHLRTTWGVDNFLAEDSGNTSSATVNITETDFNEGIAVWAENGSTSAETNTWNGSAFGTESSITSTGEWRIIQGADSNTRDETIVVGIDSNGDVNGQMWNGSSWSALSINQMGSVSETYWWGADVAYESQSDDAVMVWNDDSQSAGDKLRFSVWDGSSWTSPASISAYAGSEPQNVSITSNPNSDEMVLVVTDTSADDYVLVWDGSSWGDAVMLDSSGTSESDQSSASVIYEQQSGHAMVVYGKNSDANAYYRTWNGSSWSTESTLTAAAGVSSELAWSTLAADPSSDRIVFGGLTSGGSSADVWLNVWDGSSWDTALKVESSAEGSTYPNLAVAFESQSGQALATYGEDGQNTVRYRTWESGSGWSSEQSGPNIGNGSNSMTLDSDPLTDQIMLSVQDSGSDVSFVLWDGSSWGAPSQQESDSGETKNQPFVFLWDQRNDIATATVVNQSLTVAEGASNTALSLSDLQSTDTDTSDTALIYTVGDVTNGSLTINGSAWVAASNDTFTQQDIIDGNVLYSHDGSETTIDSFAYTVEDPTGNQLSGQTFNITVTPVNEAPTFYMGDGVITTAIGSGVDEGQSVTVQADGKILVAGNSYNGTDYDFALTRYNTDGTLDTSFSTDGILTTDLGATPDYGYTVTVQDDGKILVAGQSHNGSNYDFSLVRYNADGTLDTSFSGDGKVTTAITNYDRVFSVTVQSDGKILVAGDTHDGTDYDFALVRYNTDGTLDTSFSGDGILTTAIGAGNDYGYNMTVQTDGKILVAGYSHNGTDYDFALVRYNTDGTLDTSFSADGMLTTAISTGNDIAYSVTLQDDGKILVAGYGTNGANIDFALVRYNTDGSLDTSFSGDGMLTTDVDSNADTAFTVMVQSDGKILVAGNSFNGVDYDFAVVRYSADGTLDTSFSDNGMLTTAVGAGADNAYSASLQADGKILLAGSAIVAGNTDFALVRYNADGTLDTTFDSELTTTLDGNPTFTEGGAAVVLDADVNISDTELDALNSGLGNYADASLTLGRNGGTSANDVFAFNDDNGITLSGGNLIKNTQVIATFDTTTTPGELVISFTDSNGETPTSADVDNILRQITYANSSDTPSASVQIDWTFDDGNTGTQGSGGALSTVGSTTVNITAVDDTATVVNQSLTVSEGSSNIALTLSDLQSTDVDSADASLIYTVGDVSSGTLSINGSAWAASSNDTFTQQDIIDGNVLYSHDDSNTTSDSFSYTVEDPGGNQLTGQTFSITVTPVDDDTATVVNQSLTVAEGGANTALTLSDLQSTDSDTSDVTLTYTVGNVTNGSLTINGSAWASSSNDTFTQQDIIDGNILYSHDGTNTASDSFSYSVEDPTGNQLAGQTFSITVTPVDDDTAIVVNQSITVSEGATNTALTLTDLQSTDTDTTDTVLIYTVGNVGNGSLTINGSAWAAGTNDSFTQQDIIDGNVLYSHDGSNTTSDSFSYSVEDPTGNQLAGQTFSITVTPVDDDTATVVNQSLTVAEGASNTALTLSDLQSTDADTSDTTLIYTVGNVGNGSLSINGSVWAASSNDTFTQQDIIDGNVLYSHDGSNTTSDSFSYSVEDPTGNQLSGQTFSITVTPVDDDTATVVNQSLTVAEGATNTTLTLTDLQSTDADTSDVTLIYTVGNVGNGSLTINGSAWASSSNDTFTQQDIIDGNVLYSHDGSNTTSDSFSYSVEDPTGNQLSGQTFSITVTPVDDDTSTVVNQSLTVSEGATNTALTLSDLQSTDTDTSDVTLIYTVGNVGNGSLSINGSAWAASSNDTFTQQDIIDGNVLYSHDGTNTISDSFSYSVEDPTGNQLSGQTFSITVTPVDDDTATVVNQSLTVAEGVSNTALTLSDLQSTDADTSDVTLIYTVGNVGNGSLTINGSAWAASTNDTFTQQDIIDGNILYSHDGSNTTSDSFSYSVEDPTGNQLSGQTFAITVTPEDDDTATVVNQSLTVAEGATNTTLTLTDLQSTDADTSDVSLIYTVGNVGNGSLSINGSAWAASSNDSFTQQDIIDGTILYSHDGTNTTSDNFSYSVEDPTGNQLAGQTFSITVTPVDDDTATVVNQSLTVAEGATNTALSLSDLQSTDTDTTDASLIYTVGNVSNGSLSINGSAWAAGTNETFTQQDIIDGNVLYSHDGTNTTSDSFSYSVEDPTGNQLAGQTFNITVTPVDDDTATVVNQSLTVAEGATNTTLTLSDLQSTDTDTTDTTLIYTVGNVSNGSLSINGSAWAAGTNDSFTQQDIIDGNVLYSHDGTNTTSDSFSYSVEDPTGNQLSGQTFSITVTPVDDDTATIVNQSITVAEGASNTALTLSDLQSTDTDTTDTTLIYTVGDVTNGSLSISGSAWAAGTNESFTQQDIIDGNVLYSHDGSNTTSDSFSYSVEDPSGNQLAGQTFGITVTPVDDDTATVVNQSITVAEGATNTTLTLTDLQSTDADTSDTTLIYTVGDVGNGSLSINGSAWAAGTNETFTQQDIIDGNVLYSHDGTNTTSDSFSYTVEDPTGNQLAGQTFSITVTPVDDDTATVVNQSLTVAEGSSNIALSLSDLQSTDTDTTDTTLIYTIGDVTNGSLTVNGSAWASGTNDSFTQQDIIDGNVLYSHDGSNTTADSFSYSVEDPTGNQLSGQTFSITVTPVDDDTATVVNQSITIAEGATNTTLTLSDLQSTDTDTTDTALIYTAGNVSNGSLSINGSAWASGTNDSFTQQDIIDGNVLYSHDGTNTTSDSFSYSVEDPTGNQLAGQTFSITVTPVDDDTATVVNQSLTVSEGATNTTLTLSDLQSTDTDTADATLIYTVGNVTNGSLSINGSAWAAGTNETFTQQDIIDGNILYSHDDTNTTSDSFSYTVEDPTGNQLSGQTFSITVTPVDDDTATAVNQSITVAEGATNTALTLTDLQSTDTDTADATLIYTVGNVGNGSLTINGSAWAAGTNETFTQQDIIDGNVLYSHDGTNTTSDSFSYSVEDPTGNQLAGQTFNITVTPVDDDTATVVNQSLTVAEGATNTTLTLSDLQSTDTDTTDTTLIYTVGNVSNGSLSINGSAWAAGTNDSFTQQDIIDGNVLYSHDGTNTTSDSFSYSVEDPTGNQLSGQTFSITVTPVDDDTATIVNQSITVAEGASNTALTLSDLQSTDTDTTDTTLIYTVGDVTNGSLSISGSAWAAGTNESFTQQDIIDGNVLYSHDGSNTTSDSFSYSVEDPSGNQLAGQTFGITVTPVDDDTATVVNQSITVAEGATNTTLTLTDLQSTDADTSDVTLIYTVGDVSNGSLMINGSAWASGTNDSFTQQDIIDGNILYSHDGSNTTSDSFSYTVEDPTGNQLAGQTFSITVTPVDDDTATVVNQSITVAEGATNTTLTLSDLQSTDTDTTDTTLIYTVGDVSNGSLTINGGAWASGTNDSFTQQDIIDGNILYSHDGTNTTSDGFSYSVEDPTGNQLAGQTFSIAVTPVDDDTAIVVNQSITVAEGASNTTLTLSDLQSTDTDTTDTALIYTVGNVSNGSLNINGSAWASGTNDSFTQQDIIDGNVLYSHDGTNTTSDSFSYTVEDPTGNQLAGQTFSITVTPVDDDTATVVNQSITVAEGSSNTALTLTDLQSTDTDTTDTTLIYTVGDVSNGSLMINGSAWAAGTNETFTQQDIIDGNVLYSHDGSNTTSDSFSYSVEDPTGNQLAGQTFSITVTPVDDDTATVVNQSLTVAEGASNTALTLSDLQSTDTDTTDTTLIYTVGDVSNGSLSINGSVWASGTNDSFTQQDIIDGNILYSHDGTNTTSDSFSYSVEDLTGNQLTGQTFSITVTPVDDDTATVANQSLTVAEGVSNTALTLSDLQSTDTDTADTTLIYTVGDVSNGSLSINGSAWASGTNDSFTQQDIIDGNVLYSHDGTNTTSDSFSYSVEDPTGNQLAGQTFSITVTPVDDDTATVINQSLTVAEGDTNTALTLTGLQSTDTDTTNASLIYTVGDVGNGNLTINGSAWASGINDSFTQQDIIDGNVLYSHDGTNTTSDSFSYSVEDPTGNQLAGQTFNITITPVDDDTATAVNQSITVVEGASNTALTISGLQSTDTDTADTTLIYSVGNVTNGSLSINGSAWAAGTNESFTQQDIIDGNVLYTHNGTNTTSDSFSYSVEDPTGNQLTGQTFSIAVTPVDDDTATVVNQSITVSEGATNTALTLTGLQSTDTDTADTSLIYTVGDVSNGSLSINGSAWAAGSNETFTQQDIIDGNVLYTHDGTNTTSDSFGYTVEDPTGNQLASQTFSITVTPVDDNTATVVNQSLTVSEGATNTAPTLSELRSTDTDTTDTTLIYTVGDVSNGSLSINGSAWAAGTNETFTQQDIIDGNILYSHDGTNTASDSFAYTVEDPTGNQLAGQTFSITVTPVDDDTASVVNQSLTVAEGASNTALTLSDLQSTDSDTADTALIYTVGDVSNGSLSINGSAWAAGTNETFTQQDIIDGNILYSHDGTNTTSDSFSYTVEDPTGNQLAGQIFSIIVTPVDDDTATVINQSLTVAEGDTNTALTLSDLQSTDTDTVDTSLIYTVGDVSNGSLSINGSAWASGTNDSFTQQDIINGNILYSHDGTNTMSDSFSYSVEGPAGNQLAGQTFSVTVTPVDDDTATVVNQSTTVAEGDTNTALTLTGLQSTDTDTTNASLIYTVGDVGNGNLTINGSAWASGINDSFTQQDIIDGNVLYSHDGTNTTSDSFSYTVEDPTGNQLSGQTFSITVTPVDDDTATVVNQSLTVAEGANNTALTLSDLQSTDTDTADTTLIYTVGDVSNGSLSINGSAWDAGTNETFTQQDIIDGNILYSHDGTNTTSDSFSYSVEDPTGNQLSGQTFSITVTPVDDNTTTVVNHSLTVSEGATNTALTLSELQSTDTDTSDTALTYTVGNVTNGSLSINGSAWASGTNDSFTQQDIIDGNVLYSHDSTNTTSDSFSYRIEDPAGNQLTGQTFSITIAAVNDALTGAVTISGTVTEDQTLTASNTLADDDGLGIISYQWQRDGVDISGATNSSYTLSDVDVGAIMTVVASYTDDQGTEESIISSATDVVTNANDAPVATSDHYVMNEDSLLTTTLDEGLLANDSDIDADSLSVSSEVMLNPSHGSLTLNSDGTFTYSPSQDFNGIDEFVYEISDGQGGTATATVSIDVQGVNDAPQVDNDTFFDIQGIIENGSVVGQFIATDTDENDTFSYQIVAEGGGTAFAIDTEGRVIVTDASQVDQSKSNEVNVIIQVTDEQGLSVQATVKIHWDAIPRNIVISEVSEPLQQEIVETAEPNIDTDTLLAETNDETEAAFQEPDAETSSEPGLSDETDTETETATVFNDLQSFVSEPNESNSAGLVDVNLESSKHQSKTLSFTYEAGGIAKPELLATKDLLLKIQYVLEESPMLEYGSLTEIESILVNHTELWQEIDNMTEQMAGPEEFGPSGSAKHIEVAASVTGSFAAGFVSWLLRGGSLLASTMTAAPLWRQFDPMPVLSQTPSSKGSKDRVSGKGGQGNDDQGNDDQENNSVDESAINKFFGSDQ